MKNEGANVVKFIIGIILLFFIATIKIKFFNTDEYTFYTFKGTFITFMFYFLIGLVGGLLVLPNIVATAGNRGLFVVQIVFLLILSFLMLLIQVAPVIGITFYINWKITSLLAAACPILLGVLIGVRVRSRV